MKHTWTYEEDLICCREYLDRCIVNPRWQTVESFLDDLSVKLPNIKRSSLKMKLQNIKVLLNAYSIVDRIGIAPLNHCSKQSEIAFKQAYQEIKK